MYTYMHRDVLMIFKEEALNMRVVGTQEEVEERMGRNTNTVHV